MIMFGSDYVLWMTGIQMIGGILPLMPHLRTLKLNTNGIAYVGCKVRIHRRLGFFTLSIYELRGLMQQGLGEALGANIALTTLEIANNPIGDDGTSGNHPIR